MNPAGNTHCRTRFTPNTTKSPGANPIWGGTRILGPGGPIRLTVCNALTWMGVSGVGIDPGSVWQGLTAGGVVRAFSITPVMEFS